ncbi:MAG: PSD1 and planctomycete cytochrome C domain-containing protein [Fimbriiglobus sp.]
MRWCVASVVVGLIVVLANTSTPEVRAEGNPNEVSFEKEILPLFQAKCFSCHDQRKKTADFRLDVRKHAFAGGESKHAAIVAGKPEESELYNRLITDDEDIQMPPGGTKIPAAQAAKVKAWIAAGAKWPDSLANEQIGPTHWAFVSPKRPAVPNTATHPIDAFVLARLAKEGLKPAPRADQVTLIRRLSLDLTGLPPTPEEVTAFVEDKSPEAYSKLVERLLASPHYGERWGRLWLDAARYADSDGFEKDKPRFVHFYRDYVVNAFNKDLPYDQFVTEQLAGDLLPNPTQDQITATGFLRNSMINEEGGIDPEQFRMEAMFDRMDAIGKSMLGLTLNCAQCHTHKYDPITHDDYYRLFAFLNNSNEACVTVYTPKNQLRRAEILRKIGEIEADLKHKNPDWLDRMAKWAKALPPEPTWIVARPILDTSGGQKHTVLADGSVLAEGYAPTKHSVDFPVKLPAGEPITAIRLELLTDPTLPHAGPGRSVTGMFGLTEFKVNVGGKDVKIVGVTSDAEPKEHPLPGMYDDNSKRKRILGPSAFAIDGKDETAWTIDIGPGRRNVPRKAVFVLEKPIERNAETSVTFKLVQNHGGWNSDDNQNMNPGRFRFSTTTATDAKADPLPAGVRAILAKPASEWKATERDALFTAWRTTVAEFKEANFDIESLWKDHPEGESQLTLSERDMPRTTHLLKRGDFLKPGEKVQPGTPKFLHPMPATTSVNRLSLARWMMDPQSPTTARALVNRLWQTYFGNGLISTPEDLGTQGDLPTHPELLDYLATEFMKPSTPGVKPWSIKHLQRLIVTSQTYQQSSKVSPEMAAKDPSNKLLARGARFRVDGEIVRDIALSAAGLLKLDVGGPPVYPPIPMFLMQPPASYGPKSWPETQGPEKYRRSLYVFRFRSVPYPPLQTFDTPVGDTSCVKRTRSNTPLQALVGLNETTFLEAARGLANRAIRHQGDDAAKLTYAFRLCVSRTPTAEEQKVLEASLKAERTRFTAENAKPILVSGDLKAFPDKTTASEAAAWTALARVLLNLDETLTKE